MPRCKRLYPKSRRNTLSNEDKRVTNLQISELSDFLIAEFSTRRRYCAIVGHLNFYNSKICQFANLAISQSKLLPTWLTLISLHGVNHLIQLAAVGYLNVRLAAGFATHDVNGRSLVNANPCS